MDKERVQLNKIFRAVHDLVCPACGGDMLYTTTLRRCTDCGFIVTNKEMADMRDVIVEWGKEPLKVFNEWKLNRNHGKDG